MTAHDGAFYTLFMLPEIFINVTPLAVLLGSLMMINKMAGNLEIISLKTSGISFRRIIVFPLIISFFISVGVFYIYGNVYPNSEKRMKELKGDVISKIIPKEKWNGFLRNTENNNIYMVEYINVEKKEARNLELIALNKDFTEIEKVILAKSGKYNENLKCWELKDAVINDIKTKLSTNNPSYVAKNFKEPPEHFVTYSISAKFLTTKELKKEIKNLRITGGDIRSDLITLLDCEVKGDLSFECISGLAPFFQASENERSEEHTSESSH